MFHDMPKAVLRRMTTLEEMASADRADGTPHHQRLRQVPADTGRLLSILAAGALPGAMLEIGTSAGYSTLWLAMACRATHRRLTTFEVLPFKIDLARETFRVAGVDDIVDLVPDDAVPHISGMSDVAFCFIDAEKEMYLDCYEAVVPNLVSGGLLVADNVVSHREALQSLLDRADDDARVDAVTVPIGKGLLVCRRI